MIIIDVGNYISKVPKGMIYLNVDLRERTVTVKSVKYNTSYKRVYASLGINNHLLHIVLINNDGKFETAYPVNKIVYQYYFDITAEFSYLISKTTIVHLDGAENNLNRNNMIIVRNNTIRRNIHTGKLEQYGENLQQKILHRLFIARLTKEKKIKLNSRSEEKSAKKFTHTNTLSGIKGRSKIKVTEDFIDFFLDCFANEFRYDYIKKECYLRDSREWFFFMVGNDFRYYQKADNFNRQYKESYSVDEFKRDLVYVSDVHTYDFDTFISLHPNVSQAYYDRIKIKEVCKLANRVVRLLGPIRSVSY